MVILQKKFHRLKDVRENVRSVGFGKNPKGDRSFFMFYWLMSKKKETVVTVAAK